MNSALKQRQWNERNEPKQTMCQKCRGMKTLKIGGKKIHPLQWTEYGFAADLGCVC